MPTLAELPKGQSGRVDEILGDDSLTQRLREMGVLEGEKVTMLGASPLGDPLDIQVGDYRLSLRKVEAQRVALADPTVKTSAEASPGASS